MSRKKTLDQVKASCHPKKLYIVDGYNLLFRVSIDSSGSLYSKRQRLIEVLNQYAALLQLRCILIFDAPFQNDEILKTNYQSLEIIFTGNQETADEYILQHADQWHSVGQQTIVVTSDKKLAQQILAPIHVETVENFFQTMRKRYWKKKTQYPKTSTGSSHPPQKQPINEKVSTPPFKPSCVEPQTEEERYLHLFSERYQNIETEFTSLKEPTSLNSKKRTQATLKTLKKGKKQEKKPSVSLSQEPNWEEIFLQRLEKLKESTKEEENPHF